MREAIAALGDLQRPNGRGAPATPHLRETRSSASRSARAAFSRCASTGALPDGAQATREYIVHPGAVMVVPVLDDGRLVMERQYRYPVAA